VSLIARAIEANGTPTLILGSALDILSAGRPPRVQFLNYPLGFTAGIFLDPDNQYQVLRTALSGFDGMTEAGIMPLDFSWDAGWRMIDERERSSAGNDVRSPRDLTPRYQTEEDRRAAEISRAR
jgi:hypothetical protein